MRKEGSGDEDDLKNREPLTHRSKTQRQSGTQRAEASTKFLNPQVQGRRAALKKPFRQETCVNQLYMKQFRKL